MEVLFCVYCGVSVPLKVPLLEIANIAIYRLVIECLVIYFFFVETRGPTLEEIAVLFDGKDSAAAMGKIQANSKIEESVELKEHA